MLFPILLIIHILICVALVIVVLMQSAKGEGLAGAFGGGGGVTGAVFGGRGAASFLSRATTVLAVLFMVSCMTLSLLSSGRGTAGVASESAVTEAAQRDLATQQQQAAQQQAMPQEGEAATPEDIFNMPAATEATPDSQ
jgi:preprotein translocase subunit SecG